MKKIRNLILLAILLVQSLPCLAADITIFHGTTLDQVPSIVAGIRNIGNPLNQAGLGLNVAFNSQNAWAMANLRAAQNAAAGMTGPAIQPFVLEGVLTDGATIGDFFIKQSANITDFGQQFIGNDVSFSGEVQNALYNWDVLNIIGTEADPTKKFLVLHESANPFVSWANAPPADLSMVPTNSYIAQTEQEVTQAFVTNTPPYNVVAYQGDPVSSETMQALENAGANAVSNCGWYCGISAILAGSWTNLKIGLQMSADQAADFLAGGMGGVAGMGAVYGGVLLCDSNADNLCSNNINISLSNLLFSPDSGPTLIAQTINPFTGSIERDYSDGSTIWNWNTGIVTGITSSGVGYIKDPESGVIGSATPVDGLDLRTSQILQVNFAGQIEYLTQAGFSDTLEDAQAAVASTNALNSVSYQYPALFQIPAVVPLLDQHGTPTPVQQNSDGTVTVSGTTPLGIQYTTTVQKDSSGNIVAEVTTVIGPNYTVSMNNLTGTSQTIRRNPDGSTSIFNCIQSATVCATDTGIINYNDGWNGYNPYDASNQTFTLSMPGGGGGSAEDKIDRTAVGPGGCDEFGC